MYDIMTAKAFEPKVVKSVKKTFQVQITLVLVFDLFSFPFSVFLNSGS